jgi:hypothetical protein
MTCSTEPAPVWLYWEGPCPAWISQCQATILRHAPGARRLDRASFDALWDTDRDIPIDGLYVAHRADFIRAFLLARFGGLWIDSDCVVMRPLDALLAMLTGDVMIAHRERQGQFSNGFLAASRDSRLAREFYDRVCATLRSGEPRNWTALGAAPLGDVLGGARDGFRELACLDIQPICWSEPQAFFVRAPPYEHAAQLSSGAWTYMLSNSAVHAYQRDHPGSSIMVEGSFFRFLLTQSAGFQQDCGGARRAVWEGLHRVARDGRGESLSGPGSSLEQTVVLRRELPRLFEMLGIRVLLDAPCGDFHWLSRMQIAVDYVGIDIVPDLVAQNQLRFPGYDFRLADLATDQLPRSDLILCRDALVHCDHALAFEILRNFQRSGAEWLLTTTFVGRDDNHEIALGDWRPLNLERAPYNFPSPSRVIAECCSEGGDRYRDKALGLWRLSDLPL